MAAAPTGDETLRPDDAADVLEELLDARNQSYVLGLKLKLPLAEVDSVHSTYLNPCDRLLHVIIAFLKQVQSRPTWRVIVDALRNSAVNLPALAKRVEAAHFPDPTSERNAVSETTKLIDGEAVASTTTDTSGDVVKSKTPSQLSSNVGSVDLVKSKSPSQQIESSVVEVKAEIKGFHRRFNAIKESTIQCLEMCQMAVGMVVFLLTSICAMDEHEGFLKENYKILRRCEDHRDLFGTLNFYWNYLAHDLLDQLIEELTQKESSFKAIAEEMEKYEIDLHKFRQRTTLELFCLAEPITECDLPPGFRKVVVKHDWQTTATLEDVERFRRRYAQTYKFKKCAMMLHSIGTGCFTVTWFVPVSVIKSLRKSRALQIYKEFEVSKLEIYVQATAVCVYQTPVQRQAPSLPASSSSSLSAETSTVQSGRSDNQAPAEEDFPFVEKPSDDFFCPVTFGLLLQPHLTSCCGNHLSQEAAARIQGEGGACPLCKIPQLSTVLNKHFQRQVKELGVFCHHEDQGCGWQGELSDLERHVQSCPMRHQPLMTDLLKLPLYGKNAAELTRGDLVETIRREQQQRQQKDSELAQAQQRSTPQAVPHSILTPKPKELTVQCHRKKTAPCKMFRGSATTDHQYSYFTPDGSKSVYGYQWSTEKWEELPQCPHRNSALVIINGELTAVGGEGGHHSTNKLVTLRQRQWIEEYPPMSTACSSTAVVSTCDGECILVIGGYGGGWTATVELFQVSSRRWNKLTNIPQPLNGPSATICGNQLHVIGVNDKGYSCSLQALLSSDRPITSQSIPDLISWTSLPRLPVIYSTAATLSGQLVIIGGWQGLSSVYSIHQLLGEQWVEIGSMSCSRGGCLVVSPSPDKMMIVSGWGEDSVEECIIV